MRLLTKLTIFVVFLVLIPTLINFGLNQRIVRGELEREFANTLRVAANGVCLAFSSLEEELVNQAGLQAGLDYLRLATRDRLPGVVAYYIGRLRREHGFDRVEVHDLGGRLLAVNDDPDPPAPGLFIPAPVGNGERTFFAEDPVTGDTYLAGMTPIADREGSTVGYVTIARLVDQGFMEHYASLVNADLALFIRGQFKVGTTPPFDLTSAGALEIPPGGAAGSAISVTQLPIGNDRYDLILQPIVRGREIWGYMATAISRHQLEASLGKVGRNLLLSSILVILLGLGGAIFLVSDVKRSIFGLEPEEMGRVFSERNAILQSTHEAIVAVNSEGHVTLINPSAKRLLNCGDEIVGRRVSEVVPDSLLESALRGEAAQFDVQQTIGETMVLANVVPIVDGPKVVGAVATLRDRTEFQKTAEEFTAVKSYIAALRAQTHEFMNKLHTIAGLIQLGRHEQALILCHQTAEGHQDFIEFLRRGFASPAVSGLLLGKFNRAKELGVTFEFDRSSGIPPGTHERVRDSDLVCILGNLVENAFDAVVSSGRADKIVGIKIIVISPDSKSGPDELEIEVRDNGVGIPESYLPRIFERGFTTKSGLNKGLGLALVHEIVKSYGGTVEVAGNGWTRFVVRLPLRNNHQGGMAS
ncbi:MAG: ATP-binding protein [Firmicutes bacterium]|jgi:PAS domain S-box-containing protein|nr:ATP-binding protein [Bacillota bacterium]